MILLLSTLMSCSQANKIIDRLHNINSITYEQRIEIHEELRKTTKNCSFKNYE